jgi:hypothetical protein
VAVAIYLVARPRLTVPYRRLVVGVIALTTLHVLLAGGDLPRDLVAAIACGFLAASSVLLALGRPTASSGGSGAWLPSCIGPGSPTATCAWPTSSSTAARPG